MVGHQNRISKLIGRIEREIGQVGAKARRIVGFVVEPHQERRMNAKKVPDRHGELGAEIVVVSETAFRGL